MGKKNPANDLRYQRNFNTLSSRDQELLSRAHVAVLGLGGLGGGVCEMLARTGVGQLTLIDGDVFDKTNLNRQLLSREDLIGKSKADAALDRVVSINSTIKVSSHAVYADAGSLGHLLKGACLVVDCLDSIDARFVLQDAAQREKIPLVSGAIAGVTGQVTVIFPGDGGYELIYGKREEDEPSARSAGIETQTGNISYCALFVASLQASEAIKVLLNRGDILRNRLLIADLWTNTMEVVDLV